MLITLVLSLESVIFGPMFEAMLQGEMDNHLGYESNDHGEKRYENSKKWLWLQITENQFCRSSCKSSKR